MSLTIFDNGRLELELLESNGTEHIRVTIVAHDQVEEDSEPGIDALLERLDEHSRSISEIKSVLIRARSRHAMSRAR